MHLTTTFPVDVLDIACAFATLVMITALSIELGMQVWTAKALGSIAIGMPTLIGRMYAKFLEAQGHPIRNAFIDRMPMLIAWNSCDSVLYSMAWKDKRGV